MRLLSSTLKKLLPTPVKTLLGSLKILELDYGHFFTSKNSACTDRNGAPIPWYTYPAIEYLVQLDFSHKTVFEYGAGNSTLFWAERAQKVISIEDNDHWYSKVSERIRENTQLQLVHDRDAYVKAIQTYDEKFWVIIIDGSYRYECAEQAISKLEPGGMIILDNSDWFVKAAALFRNANLIQIDMSGFGPINDYTWTTSVFLHREFSFKPAIGFQPQRSIGGMRKEDLE